MTPSNKYEFPAVVNKSYTTSSLKPVEISMEWADTVWEFIKLPYNVEKNDLRSNFSGEELMRACSIAAMARIHKKCSLGTMQKLKMQPEEALLLCRLYLTTVDRVMWPTLLGMNDAMDQALGQAMKGG